MLQASFSRKLISFFSLIGDELPPCKIGRFNMEALWTGRILTPKCPIAAIRYWPGLSHDYTPALLRRPEKAEWNVGAIRGTRIFSLESARDTSGMGKVN